jgi:Rrf2 family iron-sulfur cluster assembly transcriptional regulator
MNLTTKGRYAVMAMVDIASYGSNAPVSLADIAQRQNITVNYLEQIFLRLRKAGLVRSVRGPGGGYVILGESDEIKVSDIVIAVDESIKMTRCNGEGGGCMHDSARCKTHHLWAGLGRQIYNYLNSVSLADICTKGGDGIQHLAAAEEQRAGH